ncbi:hypothetical protein [Zhongshania sp.]|uniref:hypothetical protein n=1 Tax=Zhongshania sp. TaxID=1971902 RepID=UPI002A80DA16|nr:hypothetical protein [Zhongshania sp.]
MQQSIFYWRVVLPKLASALVVAAVFFTTGCSDDSTSKTVLTTPQQHGLDAAKQMEHQLQQDLERREQNMRSEGI